MLVLSPLRPAAASSSASHPRETVRPVAREPLANVPGKDLIAVEVLFAPGARSVPHFHPRTAFVYAYVISGTIVSAVNDEAPRTYRAGESWSEAPGVLHRLTRNASDTSPARLLAIFIADHDETELVREAGR
jgi:quercetin dioxygenase-like cupin family protein